MSSKMYERFDASFEHIDRNFRNNSDSIILHKRSAIVKNNNNDFHDSFGGIYCDFYLQKLY